MRFVSRRNYRIHIACICFFLCCSAHAGYITRWIGLGADSLWTNPTNWDRLAVPDQNSDVIITNTGGKHVVLNVDTTVASISVLGGANPAVLDLMGVNIHADGASLIGTNATIEVFSNSSLSGLGGLQNSGTIKIPSGAGTVALALNCNFTNFSTLDIETNSTLMLTGSNNVQFAFMDGMTVTGPGTLLSPSINLAIRCSGVITVNNTMEFQGSLFGHSTWTGSGLLSLQGGGIGGITFAPDFHTEFNGEVGTTDNCTNQGSIRLIESNHLVLFSGTFFNEGLFQVETNFEIDDSGGGFVNSGTIKVPAELGTQTLMFNCNFMNSGTIDVETNSTLELPGSDYYQATLLDGTTFAGPGTIRFLGKPAGLECHGLITVDGTVEFQRQSGLYGSSRWTGPGLLRFQAGGIGGVSFAPDFHTEISGQFSVFNDCTNQGSVRLIGTNGWFLYSGTFYNSGMFQMESNCDFQGFGSFGGLANSGTIQLPENLGTQTVSFGCNFTNSGIIDVETNSMINFTGLSYNYGFDLRDGTIFDGPGTVRFSSTDGSIGCNGVMTVNGIMEFQQPTSPIFGQSIWTGPGLLRWQAGPFGGFTFAPDFHVEVSGPSSTFLDCTNEGSMRILGSNYLFVSSGSFHNRGLLQLETNFYMQGFSGSIENSGTIRVPAGLGPQLWTLDACIFTNSGTLDVEAGSSLALFATNTQPTDVVFSLLDGSVLAGAGTLQLLPNAAAVNCVGTLNVSNTVEFNSQSIMYGPSKWIGPGLLRWLNGGIVGFTFAPEFHAEISGPGWKYLSMSCTNQGTLRWLGGGNLAGGYISPEILYNEGLIQVESNGFWWDFSLTNEAGGTFSQLRGTLTVDSLANEGTIHLESGALNVQRTFSSGPGSTYQVFLGGTTPVTNYHQLTSTNLALGGSLQVTLTNGFSPAYGNTFTIATNLSQSGTFSSVTLPSLPSPLLWDVQYLANAVVLAVKATPPAITNLSFTGGQFQFSFTGPAAAAYDIQVSTNLTDWTTVQSNSPYSGSVFFTDTNSDTLDHRFYRCRIFQ